MRVCPVCGAAGFGNITCPVCRTEFTTLTPETREALAGGPIGRPLGTKPGSVYHRRIMRVNLFLSNGRMWR